MSWRHVFIVNPCKLSVRHHQLVIKQEEEVSIPLQDIASIVVEAKGVTITTQLLSQLADYRVSLISCDDHFLPNGIWMSFLQHSRQLAVLKSQLSLKKPFQKRIWQQIVKQKIINQSLCLEYTNKEGTKELMAISKTVESNDATNREAYAAKIYFQKLFEKGFSRQSDDPINIQLNYGYAIMRSAVARALVSYGFNTSIGLYHNNQLNSFNLADDFMEVLRPLVDLHVVSEMKEKWDVVTRTKLLNLLNVEMEIGQERRSVTSVIEEMVKSFSTCIRNNNPLLLKLPKLLPMQVHQYE